MESFVIPDLAMPVGIVCHDAGGANQILAMVCAANLCGISVYMEGPAKILWDAAFSGGHSSSNLSDLLANAKTLVTGTGWASNLEHEARVQARDRGIYSIAVLDHWTNYAERFDRDSVEVLPDEIWVVDECALRLARKIFPSVKIMLFPDCYADQQARRIAPLSAVVKNELLYLLEPMRSGWGHDELGEFQALHYFFENLKQLALPEDTVIRLRPHPSDPAGKYDGFLAVPHQHQVLMDSGDLTEALSRARWVAGCQTYAMTLALKAGRIVYCSLPPWAPACKLPHKGLIHIKDLVGA
jgi:hypothetical protein